VSLVAVRCCHRVVKADQVPLGLSPLSFSFYMVKKDIEAERVNSKRRGEVMVFTALVHPARQSNPQRGSSSTPAAQIKKPHLKKVRLIHLVERARQFSAIHGLHCISASCTSIKPVTRVRIHTVPANKKAPSLT
jgi:hypothetical protein